MNKGLRCMSPSRPDHGASGGPGAPARNAGSALTPLLQRLKLLAAKSSEKQFPVRRDPEFSVARSLVALGGAFLEKESVGRELDLASAHPVAKQDFVRGKRRSVVQATIRRDGSRVQCGHNTPVRGREITLETAAGGRLRAIHRRPRVVRDLEAKGHVIPLHERARIHGSELEKDDFPLSSWRSFPTIEKLSSARTIA